ncbi:hypothetical protein [Lentzea sp. NPDC059081]
MAQREPALDGRTGVPDLGFGAEPVLANDGWVTVPDPIGLF